MFLIFSSAAIRIFWVGPFNRVAHEVRMIGVRNIAVTDKAGSLVMLRE
jgi:hypothetical protein